MNLRSSYNLVFFFFIFIHVDHYFKASVSQGLNISKFMVKFGEGVVPWGRKFTMIIVGKLYAVAMY